MANFETFSGPVSVATCRAFAPVEEPKPRSSCIAEAWPRVETPAFGRRFVCSVAGGVGNIGADSKGWEGRVAVGRNVLGVGGGFGTIALVAKVGGVAKSVVLRGNAFLEGKCLETGREVLGAAGGTGIVICSRHEDCDITAVDGDVSALAPDDMDSVGSPLNGRRPKNRRRPVAPSGRFGDVGSEGVTVSSNATTQECALTIFAALCLRHWH